LIRIHEDPFEINAENKNKTPNKILPVILKNLIF
jgi:hypothetical protein